jgi:hypothetical protein
MNRFLQTLLSAAALASAAVPPLTVRTVRYQVGGVPAVAVYVVNNGVEPLDSLSLRVFVRSRDTVGTHLQSGPSGYISVPMTFPDALVARYDICQRYDGGGFSKAWSWAALNQAVQMASPVPVGIPDADGVRDWALDLPLGPLVLRASEMVRMDFTLVGRSEYPKAATGAMVSSWELFRAFVPDREAIQVGQQGWWDVSTAPLAGFDPTTGWSLSGTPSVADQSDADQAQSTAGNNAQVVVRRRGVEIWGRGPGGSGPGLPSAGPSPDEGGRLPYAAIAAPMPVAGNRAPLDSLLARPGRVRVNQAGYRRVDVAAGLARLRYYGSASAFSLQREGGAVSAGGSFRTLGFQDGTRIATCQQVGSAIMAPVCRIDSDTLKTSIPQGAVQEGVLPSDLAVGRWRAVVGTDTSAWFHVTDSVYGWVRDASLRYFGLARSGDSSWFHGPSHMLDGSLDGAPGAYAGGWYDAGDHLKEPQTMAAALATLATLAAARPERDADRWGAVHRADKPLDGVPDVLKEARWGADFFLSSWIRNGRRTGPDAEGHKGMVTGIGDLRDDHGWWGPSELQDAITTAGRGGAQERTVRRELGTNVVADVAASLALLSARWRAWDAAWADDALAAAREMYAWVKAHPDSIVSSPAYNGASSANANLALAATALLWATREPAYLTDLAYDTRLGARGMAAFSGSSFAGGWLVRQDPNLFKGMANTDWASRHALALWAFARLVLLDAETARSCGVSSEAERSLLLRRVAAGMQRNLESVSGQGPAVLALPVLDPSNPLMTNSVKASAAWGELSIQQNWSAPSYMAGNAAEALFYTDLAAELKAGKGGSELAAYAWPLEGATSLGLRHMDWILGLNHWDASLVAGVGAKNFNNAHHRNANPDGRNTQVSYDYRTPVGGLWGFAPSDTGKARIDWSEYRHSEPMLWGATQLLTASYLLAPAAAPIPTGVRAATRSVFSVGAMVHARRIQARLAGLAAREAVRIELLDAAGRRIASVEAEADARGALEALLPPAPRGVAILRVQASGLVRTSRVAVP